MHQIISTWTTCPITVYCTLQQQNYFSYYIVLKYLLSDSSNKNGIWECQNLDFWSRKVAFGPKVCTSWFNAKKVIPLDILDMKIQNDVSFTAQVFKVSDAVVKGFICFKALKKCSIGRSSPFLHTLNSTIIGSRAFASSLKTLKPVQERFQKFTRPIKLYAIICINLRIGVMRPSLRLCTRKCI